MSTDRTGKVVRVHSSGKGRAATAQPATWEDRPTATRVKPDPSVPTADDAQPATVKPCHGPIPGFLGNFDPNRCREAFFSVSGLGAYRSYRRWPGKSFPALALTVPMDRDKDETRPAHNLATSL